MPSNPSLASLCPGCFAEKASTSLCPQCGYDESLKRGPLVLPHRALLNNGQYLIGKVLGKPGGFGITYLAFDTKLETKVAIKEYLPRDLAGRDGDHATISAHSADDAEHFRYGLTQFLQEARTLARFDHANIVRVRNFFEENGTGYLVMDYYDGITLADYLAQQPQGKLPEKTAVDILMPILDGLREVHTKNILHRDIKPQNIYLTTANRAILLDFGAARQAMSERSRSLSVVLSEGYAPYEQYHRRGEQGPWTDIYSCAAVLYHMVAGEPPSPATERVAKDDLDVVALRVSDSLENALRMGLAVDQKCRPTSMSEFQASLLRVESTKVNEDKSGLIAPDLNYVPSNNKFVRYDSNGEILRVNRSEPSIDAGIQIFEKPLLWFLLLIFTTAIFMIFSSDERSKEKISSTDSINPAVTKKEKVSHTENPRNVDKNLPSVPDGYSQYHNTRFSYVIYYPAKLLMPQGEAYNGDGQGFISHDKKTKLIVYGAPWAGLEGETLRGNFERIIQETKNKEATYKVIRDDWYVISGIEDQLIFYIKKIKMNSGYISLEFSYPIDQKGTWDKVVAEVANSLR